MSLERTDPVLESLLAARSPIERQLEIERILDQAAPTIDRVIRKYSGADEPISPAGAEEVRSTVAYRLIRRLTLLVDQRGPDPSIGSFEDYVTKLTFNVIHDHVRRLNPQRFRLKRRLRYLLTRDRRFALWTAPAGTVAGLAPWRDRRDHVEFDLAPRDATAAMLNSSRPDEALQEIFERLGAPIRLDALIGGVALLWGITEQERHDPEHALSADAQSEEQTRALLDALWLEIRELPPQQRTALLLNLRAPTGADAISLLILSGVTTLRDISAALGMSPQELSEIWSDLPMNDNQIAERLGITRQRVINLRKSARDRLARRTVRERRKRS